MNVEYWIEYITRYEKFHSSVEWIGELGVQIFIVDLDRKIAGLIEYQSLVGT